MTGSEQLSNESLSSKPSQDIINTIMYNATRSQVSTANDRIDFEKPYTREIKQNDMYKMAVQQFADPCNMPDDLREEIMRQKRKDDAFKTALCDSFRRNQTCSFGEQCRFAHGVHELRLPSNPRGRNHPKYKTVLCDKFSTTGTCKYGTRCQFIHKIVVANTAFQGAQANGMMNKTSTLNQSLLMPSSVAADLSMDFNQSLPLRRADLSRSFAHTNQYDDFLRMTSRLVDSDRHFVGISFTSEILSYASKLYIPESEEESGIKAVLVYQLERLDQFYCLFEIDWSREYNLPIHTMCSGASGSFELEHCGSLDAAIDQLKGMRNSNTDKETHFNYRIDQWERLQTPVEPCQRYINVHPDAREKNKCCTII